MQAQVHAARSKSNCPTDRGRTIKSLILHPVTLAGALLLFRLGLDLFAQYRLEQSSGKKGGNKCH